MGIENLLIAREENYAKVFAKINFIAKQNNCQLNESILKGLIKTFGNKVVSKVIQQMNPIDCGDHLKFRIYGAGLIS